MSTTTAPTIGPPCRPRWYAFEELDAHGHWRYRWCFTARSDDQAELFASRCAANYPYRVVYIGPRRPQ